MNVLKVSVLIKVHLPSKTCDSQNKVKGLIDAKSEGTDINDDLFVINMTIKYMLTPLLLCAKQLYNCYCQKICSLEIN